MNRRTNRILNFFLIALACILVRVWQLSVLQFDFHHEESLKPQRRTVIERLERGTIRDRFNIPLALNKIQYNAAIRYGDIRQIPTVRWEKDEQGKKKRVLARKTYIENLAQYLGEKLVMDPERVEDMIHGKASLFPHTPFVLKEDISEELYYQLKLAEKDWVGIQMEKRAKRVYPHGKLACDLIGYMGAISPREYRQIAEEMQSLRGYLEERQNGKPIILPVGFSTPEEVEERLHFLEEKAYTINDHVGKAGVEAAFDELLRGSYGKKTYEVDIRGNPLREIPGGKEPEPGQRLILSISAELQAEAEKLLTEYEQLQDERDKAGTTARTPPWQRGGAIVVMHPKTGELLALASYPRFDPNDLVPAHSLEKRKEKRSSIIRWLENESYIGELWDGKRPLTRERYKGNYFTEALSLTWPTYLDFILPKTGALRQKIEEMDTVGKAIAAAESIPPEEIEHPRDKLLYLDLARLAVNGENFTPSLKEMVEEQPLAEFRYFCQIVANELDLLKEEQRTIFHETTFAKWRDENFKVFIKQKRKEERAKRRYAKPYVDYLEREELLQFLAFWEKERWQLLHRRLMKAESDLKDFLLTLSRENQIAYLQAMRPFEELTTPLLGKYPYLRSQEGAQMQKHLAAGFYPYTGFGFGRSHAFRQASPMGSIFKMIPSYAGLMHQYEKGEENLNPLTLIDDMQWVSRPGSNKQVLGYFENGEPIKRFYHGGRLPRAYPKIGKIDVVKALERSSNIYFSILAGDVLESPSDLIHTSLAFGMGTKTGIDLPGEYQGLLPDDLMHNKTGLYSFAIGQHSLVTTPLQSAVLFSALANGGSILKPQVVKLHAGKGGVAFHEAEVRGTVPLPEEVQKILFEGMHQVVNGERGSARLARMRAPFHDREALANFKKIRHKMVGKTGTAEILYKPTIDAATHAQMEKHVWFGAISFADEELTDPELVVIVYSRFGSAGRQGAPIAAQLTEKWHEIQRLH